MPAVFHPHPPASGRLLQRLTFESPVWVENGDIIEVVRGENNSQHCVLTKTTGEKQVVRLKLHEYGL